jgi:ribose transport system permease protein
VNKAARPGFLRRQAAAGDSGAATVDLKARRLPDWHDYIVYVGFLVILVFFSITVGDQGFLDSNNLMNIVRQTTPITIMAIGMAFCLSAGEIDLSIGSVVAFSSLVAAVLMRDANIWLAIAGGLSVGLVVGLINGLVTVRLRIPSFLVTLGTMSIVAGQARSFTDLQAVAIQDDTFNWVFGSGSIGTVSILLVWTLVVLVVGHLVYNNTRFGRHVLATGGNKAAAEAVGIKTARIKIAVLVISAMTASLAGLLYAGRLHGARYTLGEPDLLTVIAAVVIGGTRLFGGRGSIFGAVVGSIIMGMVNNGLVLMGLDVAQQMVARGVLIIVAVALSLREPST